MQRREYRPSVQSDTCARVKSTVVSLPSHARTTPRKDLTKTSQDRNRTEQSTGLDKNRDEPLAESKQASKYTRTLHCITR